MEHRGSFSMLHHFYPGRGCFLTEVTNCFFAEERFTRSVIGGHFRAILFQGLCLALNFVCLVGARGQTDPIVNAVEGNPVTPETEQLIEKANELYAKKDYDAVLPLLDRCLLLKENALGRDDPQVADVLFMIGNVWSAKRDPARALSYFQRSLAIKETCFGKDSPELTTILMSLGAMCEIEQLNTAAIDYLERFLLIQDKHPNQDNKYTPDVLD